MKMAINIKDAIGMQEGWKDYTVKCYETDYSDAQKYRDLKMIWNPQEKCWWTSGLQTGEKAEVVKWIDHKYRKIKKS